MAAAERLEAQLKRQLTRRCALLRNGGGRIIVDRAGGFDKSSHFERKFSIVPPTVDGIRDADTKEVYFSFSIGSCNLNDN